MSDISITVDQTSLANVKAMIQLKKDNIGKTVPTALIEGGELMETAIKDGPSMPVKTGLLRSSVHLDKISDKEVQIAPNTTYAVPVEVGHHTKGGTFVPGRFYMRNGVDSSRDRVRQYIRDKIKAAAG
jgi:hypothetical protein